MAFSHIPANPAVAAQLAAERAKLKAERADRNHFPDAGKKVGPNIPAADALMAVFGMKRAKGRKAAIKTPDATGWIHPSRHQAAVTDRLRDGAVAVIPEVSIPLSQRKRDRIRLDCLVIESVGEDGRFTGYFADPKGHMEEAWKQKARRFADTYGVPVLVIKK